MGSQQEGIECNKIVALPKKLSESNRFIFDAILDISFTTNLHWKYMSDLNKILSATIAGQIGHKYKEWKKCSSVIAHRILLELEKNDYRDDEYIKYKGTISVHGQYVDNDSVIGYSDIIYDWCTYDGFMTIPTDPNEPKKWKIFTSLQSTIRYLLSPALAAAEHVYSGKGYTKLVEPSSDFWTTYEKIMNTEVDHKKEYNHQEMWQIYCDAYFKNK